MKAMIFAAGLGTRLKPYTETMPKALVPVAGIPMLEILIKHLLKNGINEILINVHHFAAQVTEFLKLNNNFGANITISNEEDLLLDTGGGLKKAAWFFNDQQPFLVHNVDVISDIDYKEMFDFHNSNKALATLAVSNRTTSRYFLFDNQIQLCGWENMKTGEIRMARADSQNLTRFAFSGIHIIDPAIFNFMDRDGKFSIVDTYLGLASSHKIIGFKHNPENWVDMGKPEELQKAEIILKKLYLE
ncbi:MAG: nucleotidyltransferase family protein [Bacteroidales bacterium]|nr:nucleotidyltransferase family protein [Bacteroidales bacterium]